MRDTESRCFFFFFIIPIPDIQLTELIDKLKNICEEYVLKVIQTKTRDI